MKGQRWKWLFVAFMSLSFLLVLPLHLQAIENSECLDCHGDPDMVKELPSGKTISLYVNPKKFEASVHGQNEIACTDCHSDITELNYDQEVPHPVPVAFVNCTDCHDEEGTAYEESVHAAARVKGVKGAPICYNCHDFHYTKYLYGDTVVQLENKFCLRCHNPNKYHKWLPQKKTHFEYVMCAVCHAPDVGRHINLRLYDLMSEKFLTGEEIVQKLGVTFDNFMDKMDLNKDGVLDTKEFHRLVRELRINKVRAIFWGEMTDNLKPEVHKVTKGRAIKKCETCHSIKSPFFDKVYLIFTHPTGKAEHYPLKRKVLQSFYVTHFYAIDATRVKLLDVIGLLIVLGGVAFAGGHLTLRILTIPLRRRRREGR